MGQLTSRCSKLASGTPSKRANALGVCDYFRSRIYRIMSSISSVLILSDKCFKVLALLNWLVAQRVYWRDHSYTLCWDTSATALQPFWTGKLLTYPFECEPVGRACCIIDGLISQRDIVQCRPLILQQLLSLSNLLFESSTLLCEGPWLRAEFSFIPCCSKPCAMSAMPQSLHWIIAESSIAVCTLKCNEEWHLT